MTDHASGWNGDPYLIDFLVSGEVAQWKASGEMNIRPGVTGTINY
jgi:hypothetical protein